MGGIGWQQNTHVCHHVCSSHSHKSVQNHWWIYGLNAVLKWCGHALWRSDGAFTRICPFVIANPSKINTFFVLCWTELHYTSNGTRKTPRYSDAGTSDRWNVGPLERRLGLNRVCNLPESNRLNNTYIRKHLHTPRVYTRSTTCAE